jgi:hypothetical protein
VRNQFTGVLSKIVILMHRVLVLQEIKMKLDKRRKEKLTDSNELQ